MKISPCHVKNHNSCLNGVANTSFCKIDKKNVFDKFTVQKNVIECAIDELNEITFADEDIKKLTNLGAKISFKNGKEAVNFVKSKNIQIGFDEVDNDGIHAQWSKNQNKIIINKKYKNTNNIAEILAIAASILHEISHAKDDDSISSIQEEIDCLGMNSLAYNVFSKKYKNVFLGNYSPIIKDGVELYAKLYFESNKENLIKRICKKYGNLSTASPHHEETNLAKTIKEYYSKTI